MRKRISIIIICIMILMGMVSADAAIVYAGANPYKVEVGKYGMTPIYARDINEGTYKINVDSNSTYFKVIDASITVKDGIITGSIEIGSHSYLYVFLGTRKEAKEADESLYILPEEKEDSCVFTFQVKALNSAMDCAAYSKRKKKWYSRKILFDASSLEEGALKITLPDYDAIEQGLDMLLVANEANDDAAAGGEINVAAANEADDNVAAAGGDIDVIASNAGNDEAAEGEERVEVYGSADKDAYEPAEAIEVPYEDGEYSIEVSMTGGTGRATISSPTLMIVKDGKAYIKLLMSSPHYDWMVAGGQTYYKENKDGGNSYFIIPITAMDSLVNIVADTTAMGDPVAINYTLTYYSETIGNKGQIPQEAAKKVIIAAAIIIVVGAAANYFIKKKKKK